MIPLQYVEGPVASGKTQWLIETVMRQAWEGKKVLFISMEMSASAIAKRFGERQDLLENVEILEFAMKGDNFHMLRDNIHNRKPDIVALDYMNIFGIAHTEDTFEGHLTFVKDWLFKLATDIGVPIISAQQGRRSMSVDNKQRSILYTLEEIELPKVRPVHIKQ